MDYITLLESTVMEMSGLSRIRQSTDRHDCGIITAFRGTHTRNENMARNAQLKKVLRDRGYGVTPVIGAFAEVFNGLPVEFKENSFFVADNNDTGRLKELLLLLGEHFDQDSILFISHGEGSLIGTSQNPDVTPHYHEEDHKGAFLALGDKTLETNPARSRIRNRPFSFTNDRGGSDHQSEE